MNLYIATVGTPAGTVTAFVLAETRKQAEGVITLNFGTTSEVIAWWTQATLYGALKHSPAPVIVNFSVGSEE